MMAATNLRIPGLNEVEQDTLTSLLGQLEAKHARNFLRSSYYDGKHAIRQVGSVIPPQYYRLGLVLGWTAKGVDALARRCNLDGFVWTDGDLDSLGLYEFTDDNRLFAELKAGRVQSLIHGVSFLINTTGAPGEPSSLLHVKDALSATGTWNGRRRALDDLLSITSRDDDGNPDGLVLYLDGLTVTAEKDSSGWQIERQSHRWGVPAEPLIYKPWQRPFGFSRISRAMMSANDQAVRALIRLEGHMDIYSYPELWMLGADASIFKNADGSPKAAWQVMLGRIKGIPDDRDAEPGSQRADVKHFPASSPEPHLAALNAFAKLMAREASLPDEDFALSDLANPTSAESYTASREGLIAEAEGATDDWSLPTRRAVARGLAIRDGDPDLMGALRGLEPKWRSPAYTSRASQADAGLKQISAAPWLAETEVGLELLGLSEQQIQRAVAERGRAQARQTLDGLVAAGGTQRLSRPRNAPAVAADADAD